MMLCGGSEHTGPAARKGIISVDEGSVEGSVEGSLEGCPLRMKHPPNGEEYAGRVRLRMFYLQKYLNT